MQYAAQPLGRPCSPGMIQRVWATADEPPNSIKPELALTGLSYYVDTNFIGDDSAAAFDLRRARHEGWVRLQRTDTVGTELSEAPTGRRAALEAQAEPLVESLGPWVIGHSRIGHTVISSEGDTERLKRVATILKPGVEGWQALGSNDRRDSMHVATAAAQASSLATGTFSAKRRPSQPSFRALRYLIPRLPSRACSTPRAVPTFSESATVGATGSPNGCRRASRIPEPDLALDDLHSCDADVGGHVVLGRGDPH